MSQPRQIRVLTGDTAVAELLGQADTFKPYMGETADNADDPATKPKVGKVPLKIILSLFHERQIGGAINGDTLDLVNHMTPGLNFWLGLTSPVPKYAFDVCVPELRQQLPDIAGVPLPDDGDLDAFYRRMVKLFGEFVNVRSIPKPIEPPRLTGGHSRGVVGARMRAALIRGDNERREARRNRNSG